MPQPHTFGGLTLDKEELYNRLKSLYEPLGYGPREFSRTVGSDLEVTGEYHAFGREGSKGSFQLVCIYTDRDVSNLLDQEYTELVGSDTRERFPDPLSNYGDRVYGFEFEFFTDFESSLEAEESLESYLDAVGRRL